MAGTGEQKGIDDDTRRLLVKLARKATTRSDQWTRHRPTEWEPSAVRDPRGGFFPHFTPATAWDFIASKLEEGHPVETRTLRQPPGALGFILKIRLREDDPRLYVKLELSQRRNFVFGRSFHYSRSD